MNKLLFDQYPLVINPALAMATGLNEAIVLQQVHYWTELNKKTAKNFRDDYYWTYNSYIEWQKQFPFWSIATIKRVITSLEKTGLIITANYNPLPIDRTKWYRIDYEKLERLLPSAQTSRPSYQIDPTIVSNCADHRIKLTPPLPETNTETNADNKNPCASKAARRITLDKKNDAAIKNEATVLFEDLWQLYPRKKGKGSVSDTQKKKLLKAGREQLERCIERFKSDMEKEMRPMDKQLYGSTFFNSGYVDYLDKNHNEADRFADIPTEHLTKEQRRIRGY